MFTNRAAETAPAESQAWLPSGALVRTGINAAAWLPFAASFTVMLAVCSYRITAVSLDWDEGATVSAATRPVGQILHLAHHVDGVIAPYYLFLHFWIRVFGSSDLALRAPSLLAVALGVGLVGELGRRLLGPVTGLVAGLVCAAIPALSYYGAQARPYAIAFLLVTLATLALYRALDRPSWARWTGYGGCLLACGLAHFMATTVLAAHLVVVAIRWCYGGRDRHLLRVLPVAAGAIAALGPLALLGSRQKAVQLGWVARPTWQDLVAVPEKLVVSPQVAFLVGGLALVAAVVIRRRTVAELGALTVVPVAVILLVSLVTPLWVPRYGTFVLGPLAILAAATITAPARFPVAARAATALALITAVALPTQLTIRRTHTSPDSRSLAGVITANAQPGDGLVFGDFSWSLRPTVTHYLDEHGWTPAANAPRDLLLTSSAARVGTLDAGECRDVAACLGRTRRIWLVTPLLPDNPLSADLPKMAALRARYAVTRTWPEGQGRVSLLVRDRP